MGSELRVLLVLGMGWEGCVPAAESRARWVQPMANTAVFPLPVYGASRGGKGSYVVMLSQRERGELFEGQGDGSRGFLEHPSPLDSPPSQQEDFCFCPVISTVKNFLLRVGVCCASVPCRYGPGIYP